MDQTQPLVWDEEGGPDGSSSEADEAGQPSRPVGRLHVLSSIYGPEKDFWIYPGENLIGRLESCQVCLPASSVSKVHAVIEVPSVGGPHLLYDQGSLNRTRRQRMILVPQVRYSLQDGDTLLFGDVGCQYFVLVPEHDPDALDDFMGVPPTQARAEPSVLTIEETPAPGRKMGFGGVLVQDSDKEEEEEEVVNDVDKACCPPVSDGSTSSVRDDVEGQSKMAPMFSSSSADIVPESDEEGGEPSGTDLPDPSLRLSFESQDADSSGHCTVTPSDHNGHLLQPETMKPELKPVLELGEQGAEETGVFTSATCKNFHVDSDTEVEDEEEADSPSRMPALGSSAKDNQALPVDSDTDVEEPMTPNPVMDGQKVHHIAVDVSSDTDVEDEGKLGGTSRKTTRDQDLAVGGDLDTDNPLTVNRDGDVQKIHGMAIEVGSDTDVEDEERVGTTSKMPTSGDSSEGNQKVEVDCDTDTDEPMTLNPDADGQKVPHVASDVNSDTDVEEMGENPAALGIHVSAGNKDDDTDVDDEMKTPKPSPRIEDRGTSVEDSSLRAKDTNGTQKAHDDDDGISNADAEVEMSDLVLENSPVVDPCSSHSTSCKDIGANTGVVLTVGIVGEGQQHGNAAEEERSQHLESNKSTNQQSKDLDGKEHLINHDDQGRAIAGAQNQVAHIISVDSDTDVEEVAENPDAPDLNAIPSVTDVRRGGQSKESNNEKTSGGPSGSLVDVDTDTDAETETNLLAEKPLEEQETQLMVTGSWVIPSKKPDRAVKNEDTGVKGRSFQPGNDSSTDDDSDLTFQATQCFLPAKTSTPSPAKLRNATRTDGNSPLKSDDPDSYALEATQLFCKDSEQLLEAPVQSFTPRKEEATEPVCQNLQEVGEFSGQADQPVVSDPALRGQSATSLLRSSPQTCLEPALQPAGGDIAKSLKEKKETQIVHSVQRDSKGNDQPLTKVDSESQKHTHLVASEGESTAGLSERQDGTASIEDVTEARSSAPSSEETGQVPEHAKEDATQPVVSASGRRRNLRFAAAAPSAVVPEGRSRRQGPVGSGETGTPSEVSAPPPARRRGLRRLASPVQYMGEPEETTREPEGEEVSPLKKPKNGEPTVAAHRGRTKNSQRETSGAVTLKEETSTGAGSPGTKELTRRRSPRLVSQSVEEQQLKLARTRASRRPSSTSVSTPSPKDSGKSDNTQQETTLFTSCTGRKLRQQSSEKKPGGRSQPRNSAASHVSAPKVLFTGVIDEEGERVVTELGGCLAESIFDCTHLVTDRVRRTVKFLCAMARGIPIVTLDWLEKSRRNSFFLAPTSFLVCDPEQEKNFQFNLSESLQKARQKGGLLQGYEIHVTPNVKPEPEHMKDIIKCSGGTFLPRMPRSYKDKRLVISCPADLSRCKAAQEAGVPIANAELILMGILQQKVDLEAHCLDGAGAGEGSPPVVMLPTRTSKRRTAAPTPALSQASTAKRRR